MNNLRENSGGKKPDVLAWLASFVSVVIILILIGIFLPIIIWLFRWALGVS